MIQSIVVVSLIFACCFIYLTVKLFEKFSSKKTIKTSNLILASVAILGVSMLFLAMSLHYTNDLLKHSIKYEDIGPYGDLVGGLINPIIAFIGIIAASLAFYAQYKANQLVQEQFNLQKFESQFYEMLQIHRDNLNEMQIEGYEFDYNKETKISENVVPNSRQRKITSGKKVFVVLINEFEAIYLICQKKFSEHYNSETIETFVARQLIFDHSYYVLFNGLGLYKKNKQRYIDKDTTGLLKDDLIDDYIDELTNKRDEHLKGTKISINYLTSGGIKNPKSRTLWLSFNYKPFSGHQSLLAHYYRHLIQTVKFVVKQDLTFLSYEEKRDYLRILRATLSNHEQILLYYNWLAGFGTSWEKKREDIHNGEEYNLAENRFFTDYRMIHNIPHDLVVDEFKPNKIFDKKYQDFKYEKHRKEIDALFEIGDKIISNK